MFEYGHLTALSVLVALLRFSEPSGRDDCALGMQTSSVQMRWLSVDVNLKMWEIIDVPR
jgi:hypothetical protein